MIVRRGLPGLFAAWSLAVARFADEGNQMLRALLAFDQFIREELVDVKCRWNRGWRSSHRFTAKV
jgi:hypothetical protein